ncbi:MAG: PAS domain-containing protein [Proteobacteria bacterium]|nr:PAS domain-containing protein [Pseudomonadota bacterium]
MTSRKKLNSQKIKTENFSENILLLREAKKIVSALGKMFAPCCEVVLHDLTQPRHSIIAIACPLSGRKIGEPTTELGLARINDPKFPEVVQNYPNRFPDGRSVKSTSIGLKNSQGKFVAAICLNLDISLFSAVQRILTQFTASEQLTLPIRENLRVRSTTHLREIIETFATERNTDPRVLSLKQRRQLIQILNESGLLQLRGGVNIVAEILGISRASVYNALKSIPSI